MDAAAAANDDSSDAATSVAGKPVAKPHSLAHRVLRGGAWSLVGRVGSMGSLFLLNVVLARGLSTGDYSAVSAAMSILPLLAMLGTMGVPYTLVRVLRVDVFDVRRRRDALRGAMTLTLLGSAATIVAYWFAAELFPDAPQWQVLRDHRTAVGAWFALSALCMVSANYLQGIDDFRAAALVGARSGGLVPNFAALAVCAALAGFSALTLARVLSIQLAAYLTALGLAAAYIARSIRPQPDQAAAHSPPAPAPHASAAWYFVESWPNLMNQIIAVLLIEVDLFWIACLSNEETVAHYGAIRNLRLLVTAPLMVASVALPPFVAELHSRGDLAKLERLVRGAATVLALPALGALIVLLTAPSLVLRLVYGDSFVDAATALQILSLGGIVFVLKGNSGMVLTMTGRHRDLLICSLGCLALYIVISPPLVWRYGVVGAALAFSIQTIALNVITGYRVKQVVGIWTIPLTSWSAARDEAALLLQRFKR